MSWNLIPCAFLLGVSTVLAHVLPPTNVTLECHNMHNVLRWNYDQLASGLKFKVDVRSELSEPVELWVTSPTLHIDLSRFSDPDNNYFVAVSAVMGDDVSKSSAGVTYSYFYEAMVDQICTLDFPRVNVTVLQDNVLHFRFTHPQLLYNTGLQPKKKRHHELELFEYHVTVFNQSKHPHHFYCNMEVCDEKSIPVEHGQDKYCVQVKGTMKKISVQPTQEYCSPSDEPPPATNALPQVYIVVGVVTVILITIVAMVFMKKIRPSTSVPEILKFGPKNDQLVPKGDPEETCVVHVEPVSSTHLLSTPDINDSTLVDAPSIESEFRLPIRPSTNDGDEGDQAESIQEDVGESGYKKGNDLDEDSSQNLDFSGDTGYEKRSALD